MILSHVNYTVNYVSTQSIVLSCVAHILIIFFSILVHALESRTAFVIMSKQHSANGAAASRKRARSASSAAAASAPDSAAEQHLHAQKAKHTPLRKSETHHTDKDRSASHEVHHTTSTTTNSLTAEPMTSMVADIQPRRRTHDQRMTNRQKCLVLGGRAISSKDRHLLLDLRGLMPHAREHAKLGRTQHVGDDLIELCDLHQCNSVMYVDPHRQDVTYLWVGQAPHGPSIKMQLTNVHTADEVRMAGNCLKYSRPLLHFDRDFELQPHLRVMKSLLHMAFNTPRYHPRSKPFVDRILSFFWLDGHVWVRNYQIVPTNPVSLMEIGPRFTLEPVSIFNGCCKGTVLWRSEQAKAPTEQRRDRKLRRLEKMQTNDVIQAKSEMHRALHPAPAADPLDLIFKN